MIKSPMLATNYLGIRNVKFPVYATPKLDGIRCLKVDGDIVSRKFKPIPNNYIRGTLRILLPEGADGELMARNAANFSEVSSAVMRSTGVPDFVYCMFDLYSNEPYTKRMDNLAKLHVDERFIHKILPIKIDTIAKLEAYEESCLEQGYEGVMIRSGDSPYKFGRSTVREGYLLKIKRFSDDEAIVDGFMERMHNANEATKDAFGRTERSMHQDNMVPMDTLGSLQLTDIKTGIQFDCGTGFDDATRQEIWDNRSKYLGKIAKYKHQASGALVKPRFPVFLGWRNEIDM